MGCVEGTAEPGARLVGDRMQSQQRLTQSPVVRLCQTLERHPGSLTEDPPLLSQEVRDFSFPILDRGAPLLAGRRHRVGPAREATRGPPLFAWWRHGKAIPLRALEND